MKLFAKILVASVFALSVVVPAFAAEEDTLMERQGVVAVANAYAQHGAVKHARARSAAAARAYDAPVSAPADNVTDFSIGSQR